MRKSGDGFFGGDKMGNFTYNIFSIFFSVIFLLVLSVFVVLLFKGVRGWNKNNHSPQLTVPARIVAKRCHASSHSHQNGSMMTTYTYYVTFEFQSRDRLELHVSGNEYGLLAEGDEGSLTFQGTRYIGFERS